MIKFALTTHKLKKLENFHKNLQKAIAYGFDKTIDLQYLTSIPAESKFKFEGSWFHLLISPK